MKTYDVVALGELLIDFTENGTSVQGNPVYEANPGGAPCNVLAMLNKAGKKTAFIGKVGQDIFGKRLKSVLEETGIDVSNLIMDADVRTTLAFVETFADGDRDFSFYRNPGADMMLREKELHADLLQDTRIFHFGTLSMTHEEVRKATKTAIRIAKESGAFISFDPNLREPLWRSLDEAKEQVAYGLSQCDILKISDNEIRWFTGEEDFDTGIAKLKVSMIFRSSCCQWVRTEAVHITGTASWDARRKSSEKQRTLLINYIIRTCAWRRHRFCRKTLLRRQARAIRSAGAVCIMF